MFTSEQYPQRFDAGGYANSAESAPQFMMMYGLYPKTNGTTSSYMNQHSVAANPGMGTHPAVYQCPLTFPVVTFSRPTVVVPEEEEPEGTLEVHDSYLKAPISIRSNVVFPSTGSEALFAAQRHPSGVSGRSAVRVCDLFQEGRCLVGENCNDIHVHPDYLNSTRQSMIAWLQSKEHEFQQTLMQSSEKVFRVFCADLKEIVDVPISVLRFTKALYVDPTQRARRVRGGYQNQFAVMASQVPTACGLFSFEPSQCKWGRWCNQVHIDHAWMQSKRNEFTSWSNSLEKHFNNLPSDHLFTVHDPQLKVSLRLPKASIAGFSRGLFQGSVKKAPSICMLFQRGRCTASVCCNQIHVLPVYLQLHRQWVQNGDALSEGDRRELERTMNNGLKSSGVEGGAETVDTSDSVPSANKPNTKAVPCPRTSPPSGDDLSETGYHCFGHAPTENGTFLGGEDHTTAVRASGTPHPSQQRQLQLQQGKPPSVDEFGAGGCRNARRASSGIVLPLGEFVVMMDGDERSQSSLQTSQSNIRPAGRSYRHTNNPYALGCSSSCAASPSFGWVQPVRSAGDSITTFPSYGGGGANGTGSGQWSLKRWEDSSGLIDARPTFFELQHQDMDGSLLLSSSSLQWNASSSPPARPLEEVLKPTTDMDSPYPADVGFFGGP